MRELRKKKKMTMKELGKAVGVSESTISLYENGKHEPDLVTIKRIADILETSLDELLGREQSPPPDDWDVEAAFSDPDYESIRIMARGMKKMSPENRQKLLDVAMTLFEQDFDEQGNKKK
jgi:transcriptional regulator with XRE-family HTH domain